MYIWAYIDIHIRTHRCTRMLQPTTHAAECLAGESVEIADLETVVNPELQFPRILLQSTLAGCNV